VVNKVPSHEDVLGWRYSSMYS